jgi:predicted 3-demethylubiquinone-9 3-methyltransferase (glyoxalase superfamily)
MGKTGNIVPNLWFDKEAEAAVKFYTSVFKKSSIGRTSYYSKAGQEIHKMEPGSVLTIEFELNGCPFIALNGGPVFKFNEAVSLVVNCDTQEEVDYYWDKLKEGGDPKALQCGWLKDKFGLSWQIVPARLTELIASADRATSERVMEAMMKMKKISIKELEEAAKG